MLYSVNLYLKTHLNLLYLNKIRRIQGRGYKRILFAPSFFEKHKLIGSVVCTLLCIVYPIILLIRFFQYLYLSHKTPREVINYEYVVLSFSMSLPKLAHRINLPKDNICCIYHNDYSIDTVDSNYSIYQILTLSDILIALLNAAAAFYISIYIYGFTTIYYNLFSFHWFLTERVCRKLSQESTVLFANHMDEWAVLINSLRVKKKILVQHGTLVISHNPNNIRYPDYNYNESYKIWTYNLPFKYDYIDQVYSFTDKEYNALCESIVKNKPSKILIGYDFKTSGRKNDKFSILIIGEYATHGVDEGNIIKFLQNLNVNLFLKKHPVENSALYDDLREEYSFDFIDYDYFPCVDLVISYDSTLALQYESIGTMILYYDDFVLGDISKIVQNLMN